MNITKLSIWPTLLNLGFEPINYFAHGKKVCIGASLRKQLTDISGKHFKTDIITIEPHSFQYSNGKNYHITGNINTPFFDTFYRYEYGKKVEFIDRVERINSFYTARQIISTIELMMK